MINVHLSVSFFYIQKASFNNYNYSRTLWAIRLRYLMPAMSRPILNTDRRCLNRSILTRLGSKLNCIGKLLHTLFSARRHGPMQVVRVARRSYSCLGVTVPTVLLTAVILCDQSAGTKHTTQTLSQPPSTNPAPLCHNLQATKYSIRRVGCFRTNRTYKQELIRRWDSERELLYDDNIHIGASAYAHWTDLLISTFYYKYL